MKTNYLEMLESEKSKQLIEETHNLEEDVNTII